LGVLQFEASVSEAHMTLDHIVSIGSLTITLLAVFFGPLISLRIARRQIESSQRVAVKQVVAPMRQAWINGLREKVSALCAEAEYCCYSMSIGQDIPDFSKHARKLYRFEKEIALTLNPLEEDHIELARRISELLRCVQTKNANDFPTASRQTMELTQKILKTEWNRVKDEL
jgi:hypothetical protein